MARTRLGGPSSKVARGFWPLISCSLGQSASERTASKVGGLLASLPQAERTAPCRGPARFLRLVSQRKSALPKLLNSR